MEYYQQDNVQINITEGYNPYGGPVVTENVQINVNEGYNPYQQNVVDVNIGGNPYNPYQENVVITENINLNQGYVPPTQYMTEQVVISAPVNPPILVQNGPTVIIENQLRSVPVFINCPQCRNAGLTRVSESCDCCNLCCCLLTSPLAWVLFQLIRGKDLNCLDTQHFCQACSANVGSYSAC